MAGRSKGNRETENWPIAPFWNAFTWFVLQRTWYLGRGKHSKYGLGISYSFNLNNLHLFTWLNTLYATGNAALGGLGFFFFEDVSYYFNHAYMCRHVYSMCTNECGCPRSPEKYVGTLELELEAAVSLSTGMKLGSSVNAICALNHWAISLSQGLNSLGHVAQRGHCGADLEECMHFAVLVQALCFLIHCDAKGCHLSCSCGYRWSAAVMMSSLPRWFVSPGSRGKRNLSFWWLLLSVILSWQWDK